MGHGTHVAGTNRCHEQSIVGLWVFPQAQFSSTLFASLMQMVGHTPRPLIDAANSCGEHLVQNHQYEFWAEVVLVILSDQNLMN